MIVPAHSAAPLTRDVRAVQVAAAPPRTLVGQTVQVKQEIGQLRKQPALIFAIERPLELISRRYIVVNEGALTWFEIPLN